ncbi:UNKNOWN [Stylonychia lemnae]|uniref:Uncharacterized protein n=1 Tax=Stylonychia lemnae TaxID=5949 RepID=A0A078A0S2_STYLE|nr:UNKNOWN [Stylonychia lemnae]|eukprot:CDW75058.1 UNKNOWN [Stylonychia lemnae]
MFELFKKKKQKRKNYLQYCELLDQDYNQNKIVVSGYGNNIVKTVEGMMKILKPQGVTHQQQQSSNQQQKNKKQKSPDKGQKDQQNQNELSTGQFQRFFYNFDKDNADSMFGYRLKQDNTQKKQQDQAQFLKYMNQFAQNKLNEFQYEILRNYIEKRKYLKKILHPDVITSLKDLSPGNIVIDDKQQQYKKKIKLIKWIYDKPQHQTSSALQDRLTSQQTKTQRFDHFRDINKIHKNSRQNEKQQKDHNKDLISYLEEKYVGFFPNIPKRPPIVTKNANININFFELNQKNIIRQELPFNQEMYNKNLPARKIRRNQNQVSSYKKYIKNYPNPPNGIVDNLFMTEEGQTQIKNDEVLFGINYAHFAGPSAIIKDQVPMEKILLSHYSSKADGNSIKKQQAINSVYSNLNSKLYNQKTSTNNNNSCDEKAGNFTTIKEPSIKSNLLMKQQQFEFPDSSLNSALCSFNQEGKNMHKFYQSPPTQQHNQLRKNANNILNDNFHLKDSLEQLSLMESKTSGQHIPSSMEYYKLEQMSQQQQLQHQQNLLQRRIIIDNYSSEMGLDTKHQILQQNIFMMNGVPQPYEDSQDSHNQTQTSGFMNYKNQQLLNEGEKYSRQPKKSLGNESNLDYNKQRGVFYQKPSFTVKLKNRQMLSLDHYKQSTLRTTQYQQNELSIQGTQRKDNQILF